MRDFFRCWTRVVALVALAPTLQAAQPGDRPLRIIQTTQVRLNDTLTPDLPTNGEVRMLVLVDDRGQLKDLLLVGSSHFNFTQAAVSALQEWEFQPAKAQGQPVWTRNTVRIFFNASGRIVSVTGADMLSTLVGKPFSRQFVNRLVPDSELDAPLQTTTTVRPKFPAQLSGQLGDRATVVLDFYVDEEGRPRMPVATRSAHAYLTETAMDALDQWRFTPPRRNGHPVIVRAVQEFVFFERGQASNVEPVAPAP